MVAQLVKSITRALHGDVRVSTGDAPKRVCVVDDHPNIQQLIDRLLSPLGYEVETYGTGEEYLAGFDRNSPHCLLVDLQLPGISGLDVCRRVAAEESCCAFTVISGFATPALAVEAMRLGAVDVLEKPLPPKRIKECVERGLQIAQSNHCQLAMENQVVRQMALLSQREREVFKGIAEGLVDKQIASRLGVSLRTVQLDRSKLRQKLGISNPAQMARVLMLLFRRFGQFALDEKDELHRSHAAPSVPANHFQMKQEPHEAATKESRLGEPRRL